MIKAALRNVYHKFMGMRQSYLTHVTYKAEIRNITKKEDSVFKGSINRRARERN